MKKRAIALLLCIMITGASMTACGAKKDGSADAKTSSVSTDKEASGTDASDQKDTASKASSSSASSSQSEASSTSSSSSAGTSTSQPSTEVKPIDDLTISDDAKLADCIKLAKYKGIDVEKPVTKVSDADVEKGVKDQMKQTTIKDGACKKGDSVTISYVGKVNGKAFQGGTSTGSVIELGNSGYIDGFDDGVTGMKIGDTKDLNLKFPDDYANNADLAGKDVIFSVTLNAITRPFTTLDANYVKTYTTYDSVDAFKKGVRETLTSQAGKDDQETLETNAWTAVYDASEVKQYQKSEITAAKEQYETMMESYAGYAGMSLKDYLAQINMSQDQYDTEAENYAKKLAKSNMIAKLIADKEGFKTSDEDYKKLQKETAKEEGMDEDTFLTKYGKDVVEDYITNKRVMNLIVGAAKVKETAAKSTTTDKN